MQPQDKTNYWLVIFCDGALDFSASMAYVVSHSTVNDDCKAQLITVQTELQTEMLEEVSIPRNETYAFYMGTLLLVKIATIMEKLQIPIHKAIVFLGAISTLLSLQRHPTIYQHPIRKWLSGSGTRLFQVAKLINSQENVDISFKNVTKD